MLQRYAGWILATVLTVPFTLASPSASVDVYVDGQKATNAVLIEGAAFVEAGTLAAAAGLVEGRDWHLDGTRFVVDRTTRRDRDAALVVQQDGVLTSHLRPLAGHAYVPVDDLARALGGHGHLDPKLGVVHIWVATQCTTCRIAPRSPNHSSL